MKTVESFDKHSILLLLSFFFYKNGLNLTEENKKQEPCRQHSTMSSIKYQNQFPKIWIICEEIKFYKKKWYPKIWEQSKKVPKNLGAPQKVPKIMAHPGITTYASYPLPRA